MNFPTYSAFRSAVAAFIEGDEDISDSISSATIDLLISMGESRVYRELRASTMLAPLSLTVTANAATLPTDLLELAELYFAGQRPLEILPLDRLRRYVADGYSQGLTRYAADDGASLTFWPAATGTVLGSYYKRPEALATITWANATTLARYPECFVFACLSESAPFYGFDARIPVWEQKYQQALADARQSENVRVYGGSRLRVRAH